VEKTIGGLAMSKHEGAGNDFLVMIDLEDSVHLTADEVRLFADRHRGIGADGVITVTAGTGGGEVTMSLCNQDGSPAEISGNGLRCVAHEVVRAGVVAVGRFSVMTGAGLRRVSCEEPDGVRAWTTASMGVLELEQLDRATRRARVSVGNPHLVIAVDDLASIDVARDGAALQGEVPGGVNVEWIAPGGDGRLEMVVYERGVGPTLACGSGSCAVALAARELGLCGDVVIVENPGGPLEVTLDGTEATLAGEVRVIADLYVPLERMQ
jgi:diaminopimelate epimerase